jgi:uncharacterized protein YjbJ (UPF0337 family)
VKAQWGNLTGHYLEAINAKRVEVSGNIQEGYGITRDAAEQQIERFNENYNE